ncbi:holin [Faecalibaculum rodentium]|uniref:holin n=1 Tax=Faecalibaculum rodentium TaxID=1702221 RepID=UPI0027309C51|nr:holin [Faecalibaculum rodentium]
MLKRLTAWSFWDRALARALRTALQGFLGSVATCSVIQDIDPVAILSGTALAVLVSLANSVIAGLPEDVPEPEETDDGAL